MCGPQPPERGGWRAPLRPSGLSPALPSPGRRHMRGRNSGPLVRMSQEPGGRSSPRGLFVWDHGARGAARAGRRPGATRRPSPRPGPPSALTFHPGHPRYSNASAIPASERSATESPARGRLGAGSGLGPASLHLSRPRKMSVWGEAGGGGGHGRAAQAGVRGAGAGGRGDHGRRFPPVAADQVQRPRDPAPRPHARAGRALPRPPGRPGRKSSRGGAPGRKLRQGAAARSRRRPGQGRDPAKPPATPASASHRAPTPAPSRTRAPHPPHAPRNLLPAPAPPLPLPQ